MHSTPRQKASYSSTVEVDLIRPDRSASFIKHRSKLLYSAHTSKVQSKLKTRIATDDVFGPITSLVVKITLRWVLRSS